jgi:SAM-dependent methyltransferase
MDRFDSKRLLPGSLRRWGRAAYEIGRGELLDAVERLARRHAPLTPPRRLWHLVTVSGKDFHRTGAEFRDFLIANGLQPHHRILDVGCGIGRLAVALTGYLTREGAYEGFDIMPVAIRWCRRIAERQPNFSFQLVDLKSDRYRPEGGRRAADFVFPYPDASFDFVVLSSVFTHMLPADMRNYLGEIARVLKPGGRAVISYYLMTPERRAILDAGGPAAFTFRHAAEGYWAEFAAQPEAAIAFDEAAVLRGFAERGLSLRARFGGEWVGTPEQAQDVLVAEKL